MKIGIATARVRLAAACVLAAMTSPALAQQQPVKFTTMVGVSQGAPSVAIYWVGKALGLDHEEGIDAQVVIAPSGNMAQGAQLVVAGQSDAVMTSVESVIAPAAQGKDTGLAFVYNFYTRPQWILLVDEASGIKSVADLKGRTIGVSTLGNPAEPMLAAYLAEGGLTLKDVKVQAVGNGIPAAQALKTRQIDAAMPVVLSYTLWKEAGFVFRPLPDPKIFSDLIGASVAVSRASLQNPGKRDATVRFLRHWAKSAVFVRENPRAAIALNYSMFPQARPRNMSDEDVMARGLRAQADVSDGYTTKTDGKWGAFRPDAFSKYIGFLGLTDKIADSSALWSNELSAEINNFDEAAMIARARGYK